MLDRGAVINFPLDPPAIVHDPDIIVRRAGVEYEWHIFRHGAVGARVRNGRIDIDHRHHHRV